MIILNLSKNTLLASQAVKAETFHDRLFGMIGKHFTSFDAMIFDRCNAIHTFFMKFPIDVIFLSYDYHVLKTKEKFMPWRPFLYCKNSYYVIELPYGKLAESKTMSGDILDLAGVLNPDTECKITRQGILHAVNGNAVSIKTKG